jgi:tetratricopeptide (TPR) repeat protein
VEAIGLGQALLQLGKPSLAEIAFLEAGKACPLCIAPFRGYLYARGEALLGRERYEEALRTFRDLKRAGENPFLWSSGIGRACLGLGRFEEAGNAFLQVSAIDAVNLPVRRLLGTLFWRQAMGEDAKRSFEDATQLGASDPESLLLRAVLAAEDEEANGGTWERERRADAMFRSYLDSVPGDRRESVRYLLPATVHPGGPSLIRSLYLCLRGNDMNSIQKERWFGRKETLCLLIVWGTRGERSLDVSVHGPSGKQFDYGGLKVAGNSVSSWVQIDLALLGGDIEGFWRLEIRVQGIARRNLWFRVGGMGEWLKNQS